MYQNIEPYLEHVKGQTYCIVTGYSRLPVYKLNDTDVIMIDSGLPREWDECWKCYGDGKCDKCNGHGWISG